LCTEECVSMDEDINEKEYKFLTLKFTKKGLFWKRFGVISSVVIAIISIILSFIKKERDYSDSPLVAKPIKLEHPVQYFPKDKLHISITNTSNPYSSIVEPERNTELKPKRITENLIQEKVNLGDFEIDDLLKIVDDKNHNIARPNFDNNGYIYVDINKSTKYVILYFKNGEIQKHIIRG